MANLKSSKKDLRRIAKRRAKNQGTRTSLKTYVKKVRTASAETVDSALSAAQGALAKAAQNGVIHRNQAARRTSRAAKAANKAKANS